ncbi:MAG TPA: hypothetical protein DDZ78_10065 [Porphyromonadaceae bacterium]|nr:hypothetical protein [Porphyromonadaceae bacterium]
MGRQRIIGTSRKTCPKASAIQAFGIKAALKGFPASGLFALGTFRHTPLESLWFKQFEYV